MWRSENEAKGSFTLSLSRYKVTSRGRPAAARRVRATQPHRLINRCDLPADTTRTNRCPFRTNANCRLYPSRSKSCLTVVKGSGWESHLTVVNGIAGGRAGDAKGRNKRRNRLCRRWRKPAPPPPACDRRRPGRAKAVTATPNPKPNPNPTPPTPANHTTH